MSRIRINFSLQTVRASRQLQESFKIAKVQILTNNIRWAQSLIMKIPPTMVKNCMRRPKSKRTLIIMMQAVASKIVGQKMTSELSIRTKKSSRCIFPNPKCQTTNQEYPQTLVQIGYKEWSMI